MKRDIFRYAAIAVIGSGMILSGAACGATTSEQSEPKPIQTRTRAGTAVVETIYQGAASGRGGIELSGSIEITSDGTTVTSVRIPLGLSANAAPVDFSGASLTDPMTIGFIVRDQAVDQMKYSPTVTAGDDDLILEADEIFTVTIDLTRDCSSCQVAAGETFTVELKPEDGSSYLVAQRTLPASLAAGAIVLN